MFSRVLLGGSPVAYSCIALLFCLLRVPADACCAVTRAPPWWIQDADDASAWTRHLQLV